jgi:hypothetical protein
MNQPPLFVESIYEALREAVKALGGAKAVGLYLWPEMFADDAGTKLRDCLNPERRERLNPEQVLLILRRAREAGYHGAMQFIAAEAGYKCEPVEPLDEQASLQREYIESVKAAAKIAARLERLATLVPVVQRVA